MGLELLTKEYYDNGGGIDLVSSPTKTPEDKASESLNMDYTTDGAFGTRNGSSVVNVSGAPPIPAPIAGNPRGLGAYDYKKSDGTEVQVHVAGTSIYHSLSTPVAAVTGLTADLVPDLEFQVTNDNEYLFFGNGTDTNRKFNGTTWTNWSLPRPAAPVPADNGAGALTGAYTYYYSHAVTVGGVIVQEGELSLAGSVTVGAGRQIQVTIAVSADTQVNARVLYRISPSSSGIAYRLTTITNNVDVTYNDNTAADGTIEAEFDNQAASTTGVFEEYLGRMLLVDSASKTDVYYSKVNKPWNVPTENVMIFDGPVQCIRRCFGIAIFGTDKSIWVLNGDPATNSPRRVSSKIGILNNRCAVGEDILYILATNRKVYAVSPTDFSQNEIRLDNPLSFDIDSQFDQMSGQGLSHVCMEYYTKADLSKVVISAPIGTTTNTRLLVYNETQAITKGNPVWQPWDNYYISCLAQFNISGTINLYGFDYNGLIWKIDDPDTNGDGAEVNGTATAGGASTITDSGQTWTVNAYTGMRIQIVGGTGDGQSRLISSNTATQVTVSSAWTTQPDSTSVYTIGGYDSYHYSNWKFVLGSYDDLKQLWFIWANLNASGSYTITLILQFDFDQTITNQTSLNISLQAANTIWGGFIWGEGVWGARSVFQDRYRTFKRFRSVRLGFRNRKAGQPFQVNGFSISAQNKGKIFATAA